MRKAIVSLFFGAAILMWASSGFASYSIDGYLSDWGVTPFSDWTPGNSQVDYMEEDWGGYGYPPYPGYIGHGSKPLGGEKYDVEAMYFDDDPSSIYFAMVSSFPFTGRSSVASGDIGIGFGHSDDYAFGIKIKGLADYGHRFVSLLKLGAGESWNYSSNPAAGPTFLDDGVGTEVGLAEIYYWNATYGGGPYNEPNTLTHTWVIEGRIDRSLFPGLTGEGDMVRLHYAMACANDWIDLKGDFDTPPVPEPASLFLLGSGLIGLAGTKIRKKRK